LPESGEREGTGAKVTGPKGRPSVVDESPDRALVVGPKTSRRDRAADWLRSAAWNIDVVSSVRQAELRVRRNPAPTLLLFLPTGQPSVGALHHDAATTPLLVVCPSARRRVVASLLEAGADDVIAGPLTRHELLARARALMRRVAGARRAVASNPRRGRAPKALVAVDDRLRTLTIAGRSIPLTASEFDLFQYLARRSDAVVSPWEILESVFGAAHSHDTALVRVHVFGLRRKLAGTGAQIQTVHGRGYRLVTTERIVETSEKTAQKKRTSRPPPNDS
jgi:DNA-binding response OmpR family regulator